MKKQFLSYAVGLACIFLGPASGSGDARGRGGFSREGPAAHGGFASRSEGMRGREEGFASRGAMGGGEASRQQYAAGAQANREQYASHAQANRQQEANALQSSREQAARNMQANVQQYRGAYPYGAAAYPAWDAGARAAALGAAAATGAAIGTAAGTSMAPSSGAAGGYASSQPCAAPVVVAVAGTQFFRCGSGWYREAMGPSGPTFIAVSRPAF
jgi:hypothetical protein